MTPRRGEVRQQNRLTRLGFHFLFVGLFAMLGGAIRGLNLLLVLAALMVAALMMQWRWSRRTIEAVSMNRRLPPQAFAGTSFRVRFRLTNHSRLLPAWVLRIDDSIRLVRGTRRRPAEGSVNRLRWPEMSRSRQEDANAARATTGIGMLPARRTASPFFDCVVARRGRYRFGPSTVSTSFPFSLILSKQIRDDEEFLDVYPRMLPLARGWERRLLSRIGGTTASARRSGRDDGEFFGLREWQSGDTLRQIHWRTTARIGEPAVRQCEQQRRFDICLLVDGYQASGDGPLGGDAFLTNNLETAISLAATLLIQLVASPTNRVILATAAREADAVVGGGSLAGKRRMLSRLARLTPATNPQLDKATSLAMSMVGRAQDLLVVSPRSMNEALAASEKLSNSDNAGVSNATFAAMVQRWTRRGTLEWIDTSDPAIRRWIVPEKPGESDFTAAKRQSNAAAIPPSGTA